MIYRISIYLFVPLLFLSFFLSLLGVQRIAFGDTYYNFLQNVSNSFDSWRLEIPQIPKIPHISSTSIADEKVEILRFLKRFANFFVNFFNVLINIANITINVINIAVQLIQFCLTAIYCCKDFIHQFEVRVAYV